MFAAWKRSGSRGPSKSLRRRPSAKYSGPLYQDSGSAFFRVEVNFGRCAVAKRLMRALLIVELEVTSQCLTGSTGTVILVQVHLLIFDCAPQTFRENVSRVRSLPSMLMRTSLAKSRSRYCGLVR